MVWYGDILSGNRNGSETVTISGNGVKEFLLSMIVVGSILMDMVKR